MAGSTAVSSTLRGELGGGHAPQGPRLRARSGTQSADSEQLRRAVVRRRDVGAKRAT